MTLRIATLICMKADTPMGLALRAVASTARSLNNEDTILLRFDGGHPVRVNELEEAAKPASLQIRSSQRLEGLAHGLNQMIEEVLHDSTYQLIARMDADDESLPDRMERQRTFLTEHPEVDILGTACNEVDENGVHIQLKRLPLNHRTIVKTLPRSNPLNHPTVMIRRHVFESGLRYREDARRTEDYHLWIDSVSEGFVLANLKEPLLLFRRDSNFFDRRGGFRQAVADFNVRFCAMHKLNMLTPSNLLWACASFLMRLQPRVVQFHLYRHFR